MSKVQSTAQVLSRRIELAERMVSRDDGEARAQLEQEVFRKTVESDAQVLSMFSEWKERAIPQHPLAPAETTRNLWSASKDEPRRRHRSGEALVPGSRSQILLLGGAKTIDEQLAKSIALIRSFDISQQPVGSKPLYDSPETPSSKAPSEQNRDDADDAHIRTNPGQSPTTVPARNARCGSARASRSPRRAGNHEERDARRQSPGRESQFHSDAEFDAARPCQFRGRNYPIDFGGVIQGKQHQLHEQGESSSQLEASKCIDVLRKLIHGDSAFSCSTTPGGASSPVSLRNYSVQRIDYYVDTRSNTNAHRLGDGTRCQPNGERRLSQSPPHRHAAVTVVTLPSAECLGPKLAKSSTVDSAPLWMPHQRGETAGSALTEPARTSADSTVKQVPALAAAVRSGPMHDLAVRVADHYRRLLAHGRSGASSPARSAR